MGTLEKTPIIDALQRYISDWTIRFHMPGHKGAPVLEEYIGRLLDERVFAADVTNVPGMDDLHQTHGVIKESQELAAKTFGADHTYYLVNGSSCGLQALVMAACGPGDKILVPRNMHRSILSGIILAGAVPIFYSPRCDSFFSVPLSTTPGIIDQMTDQHPDIKAVVLVNPTYHGVTSDVAAISAITHSKNIPLLVDEAHGPHLHFHEDLPDPALKGGADATVQGTHKILSALTQASMLHIKGNIINRHRLETALRLLQSTSTSYLLLSSLDAARAQVAARGRELLQEALELAHLLRKEIGENAGFPVLNADREGIVGLDLTKITFSVRDLRITGFRSEKWLRESRGIQVEMSDIFNLLLIVSFGNYKIHSLRLLEGLKEMKELAARGQLGNLSNESWGEEYFTPSTPELAITPRDAFWLPWAALPLNKAVGHISTETIACYPPGIPVICPGERITREIVDYLYLMKRTGAHFQGCHDPSVETIRVVC